MKLLLTLSALFELGAGLALLALPSAVVKLLLGLPLNEPAAITLGRLTGAALLVLGIACWRAGCDLQSRASGKMVFEMLIYNLAAVAVLTAAGLGPKLVGVLLWPAVVLHAAMAAWCLVCLRCKRPAKPGETPA